MQAGTLLGAFSPYARVATALAPFLVAMLARLLLGRGRVTGWMITLATVWFAANVLTAPFSARMLQDVRNLQRYLP